MSKGREKLQPWLERKLENGSVPGVEWLNRDEGTFQILWKRNTHTRSNERDFQIFKDWAKHTGRFKEGDVPDFPYWKTLLRNALNKQSNIEEKKEVYPYKSNNCPYRVFQIKDYKSQKQSEYSQSINYSPCNNGVPTFLSEYDDATKEKEEEMEISLTNTVSEPNLYYFTVTVKIGSQFESSEKVATSCLIKTGNYMDDSLTSSNILRLQLHSLSHHPRGRELINGLERGIYIHIDKDMNIFAKRSCQCRVFYISQRENQESNNLERNKSVKIFDFGTFLEHLDRKVKGLTNIVPQSDIFMSVGQRCCPNLNLLNDILLSITITSHVADERLKERNLPKYNSIQMSEPDSIDRKQLEIKRIEEELLLKNVLKNN